MVFKRPINWKSNEQNNWNDSNLYQMYEFDDYSLVKL